MNIKSDPEVVQRWHTHHWIGNFDADLSMRVSRPYEANLGRKKPPAREKKNRENIFGRKFVSAGSRPDSRRSRELNRRLGRPGEGQGGANKSRLDPKIGQNSWTKKNSDWSAAQACHVSSKMLLVRLVESARETASKRPTPL